MFELLIAGFGDLFKPASLLALTSGTIIGYFIGAMPGLNSALGIALLLPFTFGMDPVPAIILLTSLYMASEYGGGLTAILVNTPGNPASAATALDGYPLAQQGKAGKALGVSILASGFGNFVGAVLLIMTSVPLAAFALRFGGPEYFALAFFGLSMVSSLSSGSPIKGWISAFLGLLVSCIGLDRIDGVSRYVFNFQFLGGIPFVPAMVGLFAFSEVMIMLERKKKDEVVFTGDVGNLPTISELKTCLPFSIIGVIVGYLVGIIPAVGTSVATWLAYDTGKRFCKNPNYGKGALEGVATCEAATNATTAGAMVPTLTLGIPGAPGAAVLMGAFTIQGLQPGPLLFARNPEIPYAIFATFLLSAPVMTIVGLSCAKYFARVTIMPREILAFLIVGISVLGTFALENNIFNVWIAFVFGILGYFMKKFDYPTAPMVLAMVLGPLTEFNFRLALLMGHDNPMIFVTRPISLTVLVIALISFMMPLIRANFTRKK